MQHLARHPAPSPEAFAFVDPRYVAMPAALWGLVIVAVVISALAVPAEQSQPSALPADTTSTVVIAA